MSSSKPSVTRRSHRKSRTGCKECKRRRIKCTEDKPRCLNCVRHQIDCVYLTTGPALSLLGSTSFQSSTSPHSTVENQSPQYHSDSIRDASVSHPQQSLFELKDLALLHHWSLYTSLSIGTSSKTAHVWQLEFPRLGVQYPYVMHSIMSLAALHLAYLNPSSRRAYMLDAAQLHTTSLQGFREAISQVGQNNSGALFVNSTLVFLYAFVTFGTLYEVSGDGADSATRTSRILGADWIPLVRGIKPVLQPVYNNIQKGPLSLLLQTGNWDHLDPDTLSNPADKEILRIKEIWEGDKDAEVYDETLYLLRKFCAWNMQFRPIDEITEAKLAGNEKMSGPFIWVSTAPEEYFQLLQQRQPPALVIFAFFGAELHGLNKFWWVEGGGKTIVGVVDEFLGPFWKSWLDFPRRCVGLD